MASGFPDWTRAIRLLGLDEDGNPVTVLMDPDGNIGAVLKGDFEGALRTIGLDDDGRITAYMADDESQWGNVVKVGNAELAARLGSPASYDWRGKVVAMVDFSRGLGGMYTDAGGAGGSVALDPTNFLAGGYSLKMTGGSDGSMDATVFLTINIPPTNRIGFCITWASDVPFDYLEIWLRAYDGTTQHAGKVRFARGNDRLEYQDENQAWQTLVAHYEYLLAFSWHSLKLVMDVATDKYVRCLAGKTEHDMSALDLYTVAHANNPRLEAVVKLYSTTAENRYAWLDSMIVTVGEPA